MQELIKYSNTFDTNYYIRNKRPVLKQGKLIQLQCGKVNYSLKIPENCTFVNIIDMHFQGILYEIDYTDTYLRDCLRTISNVTQIQDYKFYTADTVYDVLDCATGVKVLLTAFWAKQKRKFICLNVDDCGVNVLKYLYALSEKFPIILYSTIGAPICADEDMYEVDV
jgi:hypothetical protein